LIFIGFSDNLDAFSVEFASDRGNDTPVVPAVVSIITLLFVIFVVAMRKFIALAIELLREAAKAVICMSKLLAVPFIVSDNLLSLKVSNKSNLIFSLQTSVAVFLVTGIFVVFVIVIETASQSTPQVAYITHGYNFLVYCWFVQFLMDCQHMIVAGAVGKWFFTR
jgi:solute carrier family 44 (choline transporter-like protein), member 1